MKLSSRMKTALLVVAILAASLGSTIVPDDLAVEQITQDNVAALEGGHAR